MALLWSDLASVRPLVGYHLINMTHNRIKRPINAAKARKGQAKSIARSSRL